MSRMGIALCLFFLVFGAFAEPQLEGGLLGILKPEGVQVSVPELLGISNKKTTTTTTTTLPPPPPSQTEPPRPTRKPHKPATERPPCNFTPTTVNGKRSCEGKLIFQENFGKIADQKWIIENRFAGKPDYEFVLYQDNSENIFVKNNKLHIKPSLTEERYGAGYVSNPEGINLGDICTAEPATFECVQKPRAWQILPPVLSSQISTRNHLTFAYGTIEIKAKLPKGDWIYPEISLRPKSHFYGSGHNSGEIKIAFLPGNAASSKHLSGGVILGESVNGRSYGIKTIRSERHWNDDFHVFVVEWTPDGIILSVDGQVYGKISPSEGGFAAEEQQLEIESDTAEAWRRGSLIAPFDKEMYLTLGVGVGGQCLLDKDYTNKPWHNDDPKAQLSFYRNKDTWSSTWNQHSQLVVDYVKIWAV